LLLARLGNLVLTLKHCNQLVRLLDCHVVARQALAVVIFMAKIRGHGESSHIELLG